MPFIMPILTYQAKIVVSILVWGFIFKCMQAGKALGRLQICADYSEPTLLADAISTHVPKSQALVYTYGASTWNFGTYDYYIGSSENSGHSVYPPHKSANNISLLGCDSWIFLQGIIEKRPWK